MRLIALLVAILALHLPLIAADPWYVAHAGPDARLAREWSEQVHTWNRRTLVDAYDAHGRRDPRWDDDAHRLLNEWARRFSGLPGEIANDALRDLAIRLIDEHACPDALVQYAAGKTFEAVKDQRRQNICFITADLAMRNTTYPWSRRAFAALRRFEAAAHADDEAEARTHLARIGTAMTQAWATGEYDGMERLLVSHLADQSEPRNKVLASAWYDTIASIAESKRAHWAGQHLLGTIAVQRAWLARGSGYANTVTEEGWKVFHAELAKAQEHLQAAWTADPNQPQPPTTMITVAMGIQVPGGGRQWFERAIAAEFDHRAAYEKYTWSLRPRWGGSHRAMLTFGQECVLSGRFDTNVPYECTNAILEVFRELRQNKQQAGIDRLFADAALWASAKATVDGYIPEPSQSHKVAWNRSLRVALAWRFGQREDAQSEASELGPSLQERALKLFDVTPAEVRTAVTNDF